MIYLGFPYGSNFGWGVLGKEIALAMAELTDVRLLTPPKADQRLDDEIDLFRLRKLITSPEKCGKRVGGLWQMDGPVIQAVIGRKLEPFVPGLVPPADVGYAVFEENILPKEAIEQAKRQYRHIAAASTYCANILRQHGLTEVSVVPHGVDTARFCPRAEPRSFWKDRFVVFSGGKFELRKGQDIVIRAYKVLQDRHPDVMLVNSWHNPWPETRDTMAESRLIRYFPPKNKNYVGWMNSLLAANGIDIERVVTVGPRDHRTLPDLYHATDLGIFPNRVEGGNNMVLMEYLACGKPALVSFNSGHTDIVRRTNAVLIECHKPMERPLGTWHDPSLEETVEKLEWCYRNRDELKALAKNAASDMRSLPWRLLAEGLSALAAARCRTASPARAPKQL